MDYAVTQGLGHGLGLGVDLQLLIDVTHVKRDSVYAHPHFDARGLVIVAIHQQLQEAGFVRREAIVGMFRRAHLPEQFDHPAGHFRRHRRAPGHHILHALQQARRRSVLQQIAAGAGANGVEDARIVIVNREHQEQQVRVALLQLAHALDPKYRDFALWFYERWSKRENKWDATLPSLLDLNKGFVDHGVHTYENIRVPLWLGTATGRADIQQAAQNAFVKIARYSEPSGSGVSQEWIKDLPPDPSHTEYEYCATKELQFTFESALQKTGRSECGDRAELIWFNAAQGARLPDGSAISYLTSDNRSRCDGKVLDGKEPEKRNKFSPAHVDVAVCCNPNATQVAALFVRGMWMSDPQGGLVAMLYGPCVVSTTIAGTKIRIEESTLYPFEQTVDVVVHPEHSLEFPLWFRNPLWSHATHVVCEGAKVEREGEYW